MSTLTKLKLDVDALRVDSFRAAEKETGEGTVHGHGNTTLPINSGSCTAIGSCDACYTASAARPYCY